MDNNSQSFIHIKYSEKNIVCFHLHLFIYEILIHFVELNFKLTQYCMVSWYYLVSWYFSWYSIVRHFYGIVTTLVTTRESSETEAVELVKRDDTEELIHNIHRPLPSALILHLTNNSNAFCHLNPASSKNRTSSIFISAINCIFYLQAYFRTPEL